MQRRRKGGRDMADYSMTDEKWNDKKEIIGEWFEANPEQAKEHDRQALANGFFAIGDIKSDLRKKHWTSISSLFAGLSNIPPECEQTLLDNFEEEGTCVCNNRECEVVVDCDYVCSSCSHPFCEDCMECCNDCSKRFCESCWIEEEHEPNMCSKCTDAYHQSDHLDGLEHAPIGHRQGGLDPYKNDE